MRTALYARYSSDNQRDASVEEPGQADLYAVGTASQIHKMFKLPDGSLRLIVQGLTRLTLDQITETRPYLRARVSPTVESFVESDRLEIDALLRNIKTNFQQVGRKKAVWTRRDAPIG